MDEMGKETEIMDEYIVVGMVILLIYGLLTGFDDGTSGLQ